MRYDVLIVGGGAVGLTVANLCSHQGLSCLVIEKRTSLPRVSLAIGITPPSLEILKLAQVDKRLISLGIPITQAEVFHKHRSIGKVSFRSLTGEYPFILSLPENHIVKVLQESLQKRENVRFVKQKELFAIKECSYGAKAFVRHTQTGKEKEFTGRFLVACDGAGSSVRRILQIEYPIKQYRPRFLLGDFTDTTSLCDQACLFFHPEGSVESFPIGKNSRRWIIQLSKRDSLPGNIPKYVFNRCKIKLERSLQRNELYFVTSRALIDRYFTGNILFAGNAAHLMSPVGGQGLNTGIADADFIAKMLPLAIKSPDKKTLLFEKYESNRKKAFIVAADRAALCMKMGTKKGYCSAHLRSLFLKYCILRGPIAAHVAPFFAMQTIPHNLLTPEELNV